MSTRSVEKYHPYFAPNSVIEELQKAYSESLRYSVAPRWLVAKDKLTEAMDDHYRQAFDSIGTVVNVPPVASNPVMVLDMGRVCYHCDATDGVSGVVPLCRKCR